jgi:hypothetical protein
MKASLTIEKIVFKAGTFEKLANRKNQTNYKELNQLAKDPRVVRIWDEGDDGLWVELAKGYNSEGTSHIHEWSVKDLIRLFNDTVEEGNTY